MTESSPRNDQKNLNRLQYEKSPYLLQHSANPVDWYPWGEEAFDKAKSEDKPVFLSIGYSTCHWCHVMEEESFEDLETADLLNEGFVSIKVDREKRPDIDSVYMAVCQQMTGSGGWPTSIFLTPDQKPFFAGTYFPKVPRYGMLSFPDLLSAVSEKWRSDRTGLVSAANEIVRVINSGELKTPEIIEGGLPRRAYDIFKKTYDDKFGGFGNAPKFPSPHNLLFLMDYHEKYDENFALEMVEFTLTQMFKGGIFDHIGYGFSRYSTDKYFLAPHFEKMLYDNALLMMCYTRAFELTDKPMYKFIAEKIGAYIEREMTSKEGAFYCAQDADIDGIEGKYYLFDYDEITQILGAEDGAKFQNQYNITKEGNFEGKNILNLLHIHDLDVYSLNLSLNDILYEYRKSRYNLKLDDKILTSWNALMIAAYARLAVMTGEEKYLNIAVSCVDFIEKNLLENDALYVSIRDGKRSEKGFIDDYAFYAFALIELQKAHDKIAQTPEKDKYILRALSITQSAVSNFFDKDNGGFFLYGGKSERLIARPKDIYDGAIPSGNSVMAYVLASLSKLCPDFDLDDVMDKHFKYMSAHTRHYAAGFGFFMSALILLDYQEIPEMQETPKFCCREDGTCG